jgi:hypothetical protein
MNYNISSKLRAALTCRRGFLLGAVLAAGLVGIPWHAQGALASIGSCRTDPMLMFSNGTVIKLETRIGDSSSDVQQIIYTVNAPAGTTVTNIVYTGGELKDRESVQVQTSNSANSYDTSTQVFTGQSGVSVTAETKIPSVANGSATGFAGDTLLVHIGN